MTYCFARAMTSADERVAVDMGSVGNGVKRGKKYLQSPGTAVPGLGSSLRNFGPGSAVGDELAEQGVRVPAVEDDRPASPGVQRLEARLDLRYHAAGDDAVADQRL